MSSTKPSNTTVVETSTKRLQALKTYVDQSQDRDPINGVPHKVAEVIGIYQASIDTRTALATKRSEIVTAINDRADAEAARLEAERSLKAWVNLTFGSAASRRSTLGSRLRGSAVHNVETKTNAVLRAKATRAARNTMGKRQKAKVKGVVVAPIAPAAAAITVSPATPGTNTPHQAPVGQPTPPQASSTAPVANGVAPLANGASPVPSGLAPIATGTAARRVLLDADVRHPRDINVEAIAARLGAMVVHGTHAAARGSIVRAGRRAIIRVDERAAGKPWSRFTTAHETGHLVMHPVVDHFVQCDASAEEKRGGDVWRIEREANHFGTELLIPALLAELLCGGARPTVDDIERLALTFNASFDMSSIRMVQLATAPCARVLAVNGVIKQSTETEPFPGKIVMRRPLHPRSVAVRATATKRGLEAPLEVPGEAWGGEAPFVEHALRLGPGTVMSWILPAA